MIDDIAYWISYLTNGKHLTWYASFQFTIFAALMGGALAVVFGLLGALYMMVGATRALVEHERQLASARTRAAEAENQATAARAVAPARRAAPIGFWVRKRTRRALRAGLAKVCGSIGSTNLIASAASA